MRARPVIFVMWLSACRTPTAPAPEQAAGDPGAAPSKAALEELRAETLPPLPADLVPALRGVYEAVARRHAQPMPSLDGPLATNEQHQAWVDRELEPWRESMRPVGVMLEATRPESPDLDAPDDEVARFTRVRFVHSALAATLALDESIARVRIPLPDEARQGGTVSPEGKQYMAMFLADELDGADFWRSTCTQYASGFEPVPADLESWALHCQAMFDTLIDSTCAAEREADLGPSVYCSGHPRSRFRPGVAAVVAQAADVCAVAKEVLEDTSVAPAQRVAAWRARMLARGVTHVEVESAVRAALEIENPVDAAWDLSTKLRSATGTDWTCDAVDALLRDKAAGGAP